MNSVRIEVPATSANLGPGFDSLGLAIDLVDAIEAHFDTDRTDIVLEGCEEHGLDPRTNLVCRAYRAWEREIGTPLPGVTFRLERRIPIGRGLGSSAAAIVAGLAAAAHAAGDGQPRDRMLRLAGGLEGHPDNTSAAVLGGVVAAFCDGTEVHAQQIATHLGLGVAIFMPERTMHTGTARQSLPESVPMRDAVYNLSRVAYLTAALVWGQWERIGPAMEDRLHQPYRATLLPGLDDTIAAARAAGAYGAALSGSGPSVLALGPPETVQQYAAAMAEAGKTHGWNGETLVTRIREKGLVVTEIKGDEPSSPS